MTLFGVRTVFGTGPLQGINPDSPGGLIAWFDMQDNSAFTVLSGVINSITNKISGVVWTTPSFGQSPLFSASKLGGRQCMDCDGTNDIIVASEAAVVAALTDSPALTFFGVVQSDVPDNSVYFFSAGSSLTPGLSSSRGFGTNITGTGNWLGGAVNDAGTGVSVQSAGSTDDPNPHVFEYFSSGSVSSIAIDGGAPDPNGGAQVIGTLTPNQCGIGGAARQAYNAFWNGAVGEILVYNRQLTVSERSAVRSILGAKWGIAVG